MGDLVRMASANAGWLLTIGLIGLIALHIWLFRRDQARIQPLDPSVPFPTLRAHPKVSVLVAAWNEADHISAHIESFQALRYPNKELIVCAGGADGTYAIALRCAGDSIIVLEQQPGEGKQRALRRCYARASGEIIFLTDADGLLSDMAFEHTLAPILNDGERVVTGRCHPLTSQRDRAIVAQHWLKESYVHSRWGAYTGGILGCNAALTRAALDGAGAFAADVPTGTDLHLAKMLLERGERIRFAASSSVETYFQESFAPYRRQQARWLRNQVIWGLKFRSRSDIISGMTPMGIGIGLIALFVIGLFSPLALAVWGLLLAHMLMSRARYLLIGGQLEHYPVGVGLLIRLPLFTLIDVIVWASAAFELIDSRRRARW
jgi:cellulose synthase/poly-beta-1,6-N-acetylglucosamine synthase-like glycosyltransferase